jgi:hypothetical protein
VADAANVYGLDKADFVQELLDHIATRPHSGK